MKKHTDIHWAKINSFVGNTSSNAAGFNRPCPICGSLDSKTVLELSDFQFYSDSKDIPKRFNVTEKMCLSCFALYLNSRFQGSSSINNRLLFYFSRL